MARPFRVRGLLLRGQPRRRTSFEHKGALGLCLRLRDRGGNKVVSSLSSAAHHEPLAGGGCF